ncbi:MAG: DNA polymerase III subunit delta [Clostridia bacterium]|nr:DNA polymerase III subunit delta [Clostridia bacterium]
MSYETLEKELNEKKLESIYLFWGNDKFLLDEAVKKIKKIFGELQLGINYILIDDSNLNDIIPNIETPAFGYDKKLIIIRNSGLFKKESKNISIKEKLSDYIDKNMDLITDSCIIVFIEEEVNKYSFYKLLEKKACLVNFEYLKPAQIKVRLKKICNAYKVNISDNDLMYLIEVVGTDMQNLINEIRKLIEYAGSGNTIKKEDIDNLSTKQIQAVIFQLTDLLGDKKIDEALNILDNLIYQKEPLPKILITLYNHFKKVYLASLAIKNGNDIAKVLDLKTNQMFLISKYRKQANFFKIDELEQILNELIELDYKYKIGEIDIEIALKSILCKNYL